MSSLAKLVHRPVLRVLWWAYPILVTFVIVATTPFAERRERARNALIESRLTPNAISLTGLALNVVAAVLVYEDYFFLGGIAFIVGSVMDTLDGRYSRMSGKGTQFGAFLDSTHSRIAVSEDLGVRPICSTQPGTPSPIPGSSRPG